MIVWDNETDPPITAVGDCENIQSNSCLYKQDPFSTSPSTIMIPLQWHA